MAEHTTVDELARVARLAVSLPSVATLEVDGGRPVGPAEASVGLAERGGLPTFHCGPSAALVQCGEEGMGAVLTVQSDAGGRRGPVVRLVGRLVVAGWDEALGHAVALVQLVPVRISVHVGEQDRAGLLVPLDAYERADEPRPDLGAVAQRIMAHSNGSHGQDLREYIARRHRLPVDDVVAAELTGLDERGAVVSWIDGDGANRTYVPFATPVSCPGQLADVLRAALEA
jgi:hypothetical protein